MIFLSKKRDDVLSVRMLHNAPSSGDNVYDTVSFRQTEVVNDWDKRRRYVKFRVNADEMI